MQYIVRYKTPGIHGSVIVDDVRVTNKVRFAQSTGDVYECKGLVPSGITTPVYPMAYEPMNASDPHMRPTQYPYSPIDSSTQQPVTAQQTTCNFTLQQIKEHICHWTVLDKDNKPIGTEKSNDGVILTVPRTKSGNNPPYVAVVTPKGLENTADLGDSRWKPCKVSIWKA